MAQDPLTQEIDAMAIIGQLLGKLPDGAARQRVLTWAVERYRSDAVTPQAQPATAAPAALRDDSSLAVDSLKDLFVAGPREADDDLIVPPLEPVQPAVKQPVQSILQSFASEFRRFADEWKGAAA
jgi:hypothetical protein